LSRRGLENDRLSYVNQNQIPVSLRNSQVAAITLTPEAASMTPNHQGKLFDEEGDRAEAKNVVDDPAILFEAAFDVAAVRTHCASLIRH
jgi:hypothetical protein